jgi:hypothetical protein
MLDGGLAAASVVVLLALLLALLDRGDRQHVAVQRLFHPVLSLAAGGALMLGATVRRRALGELRLIGLLIGALAVALAVPLGFVRLLYPPDEAIGVRATSPHYQVVAYRSFAGVHGPHRIRLVLRTREGLSSRESGAELACFLQNERHEPAQPWFLDQVEFAGPSTLRFVAATGVSSMVDFDPDTLLAWQPVDQCPNVAP